MSEINTNNPKVSVVMSFYKEPLQWMDLALDSILNQTFRDFEIILICDNPDYSEGISHIQEKAEQDSRIRLYINESNIGLTKSLNKALGLATGEYIARMDADDIALPVRFARQVEFLDSNPDISVCASDVHIINSDGEIIRRNKYKRKCNNNWYFITNVFAHPSVMFRRDILSLRSPLYNENFRYSQDYELWNHLIVQGYRLHTLKESLLLYRKSEEQISSVYHTQQIHFFKLAHKALINNWLISKGIIREEDKDNLEVMLEKSTSAYRTLRGTDREYLTMIIYIIYFSLGTYSWKYRLKYLVDRNFVVFRIKFILTFRLFVSSRTRKNRTGFL